MSRMKSITVAVLALGLVASLAYAQGGSTTSQPTAQAQKAAPAKAKPAMKHAMSMRCDINSASKEALAKLPGIDEATADKIAAGRPFKTKAELVSKGIVTKEEYAKIATKIVAKQEKESK